jgi:hypothetical protein
MFSLPLMELLRHRGLYYVHAAGLCIDDRGLLVPGTSGCGKSTLALTLVRAGFGFLGDDTLFLAPSDDHPRILAFPDEIDLTEETVEFFRELRSLPVKKRLPGGKKMQIRAEDVYGAEFIPECTPAILVFPRVAQSEKSVLCPMDRDEAFLELVPNILLTEAHTSQAHLDVLAELVRESDCYRLETGRDFEDLPRLLQDVMAQI